MNIFYRDKKVLVTGGTGFIGSHIAEALAARGARVRIPVHRRPLPFISDAIEMMPADLTVEADCLRVTEGVDFVFHAAGAVGSAAVRGDRSMAAITTSLVLTARVLQAAWAAGAKRFLLFSSSTGYPAAAHPVREAEMWSGPPFSGYFGYGSMRRYLEQLAKYVQDQSRLNVALVRPTAVYGRRDCFDPSCCHVIPALIRRALEKENPFVVWGSPDVMRDFLHVSDLARACLLMLENYAICDPVNIGFGRPVSIKTVAEGILHAAGHHRARVTFDPFKPTALGYRAVDTAKARKILGFEPSVSLEDGLRDTVDWYTQVSRRSLAS